MKIALQFENESERKMFSGLGCFLSGDATLMNVVLEYQAYTAIRMDGYAIRVPNSSRMKLELLLTNPMFSDKEPEFPSKKRAITLE